MNGLALFGVLVTAKLANVIAVGAPPAAEWPASVAGDAALCLGYALVARLVRARSLRGVVFGAIALHAAIATALVAAIGTPMSRAMLDGLDSAMGDSIGHAARPAALVGAGAVLVAALAMPPLVRRVGPRVGRATAWSGLALAAFWVVTPEPALPAHRNALLFFWGSLRAPSPVQVVVARSAGVAVVDERLLALRGAARERDVVLVVLESVAARFISPYGASEDPMPFLTTLAARSLVVSDAYAVYPESIKGQIAVFHAVHPAPGTEAKQYANVPVPGLATLLGEHGYATGLFHSGRFRFLGMRDVLARSGFEHQADAATISGVRESSFGVDEEATVDALLAWLDAQGGGRTFAAWLPIAGHHPYDSPPGGPFDHDTMLGCYRNALWYADRSLRRLCDGLAARGRLDRTLLVVVGDHGQAFGEHDGNFGHTFALYEENLRVPLIVRMPGATDAGITLDAIASHVDLAPTILDFCGLPPCDGHEGSSLLRVRDRPALFFADWGASLVGVRDGRWKAIFDRDTRRELLFDLVADPQEAIDRSGDRAEVVTRLRALAVGFFSPRTVAVAGW